MKQSTKWFLIISGILVFIGFWMTIFILILKAGFSSGDTEVIRGTSDRIALVELSGPIYSSDETVRQLKKYRDDNSIKAILLRVESPGGGVVASQEIYEEVCKTRESGKPMVVSCGSTCGKRRYYVSCGDRKLSRTRERLRGASASFPNFSGSIRSSPNSASRRIRSRAGSSRTQGARFAK
jgi:protease-4